MGCKAKIEFYNFLSRLIKEIAIVRISEFDSEAINHLAEESLSQGFRFVDKLIREYSSGLNCFDRSGEMLLTASVQGAIVRFIPFEEGFSESVDK